MELWLGEQTAFLLNQGEGSLLNVQGNLGFIDIQGSLSNNSWLDTTYTDIRNALVAAANDPAVEHIVLNMDSPGGAVSGLFDVAQLVRYVNDNVKPVVAHTSGKMTSAAYAIGAAAGKVYASASASLGSVGVVGVHFDMSKYYEQEGIVPTVLYAGEEKTAGNPYEPLSDKAKAVLQKQMDSSYQIFIDHVAEMRNRPQDEVKRNMAEGRVFTGQEAMNYGLIDGVMSLDNLVHKLIQSTQERKTVAKRLPAHTVAAIAAGIPVDAAVEQLDSRLEIHHDNETEKTAPTPSEEVSQVAQAAAQAAAQATIPEASMADRLQSLLESKLLELAELKAENSRLKADNVQFQANETLLRDVVHARMNHLEVALRCAPTDRTLLAGLSTGVLLAQHNSLQTRLEQAYPVGGVSKLASTHQEDHPVAGDATLMKAVTF